MPSTLEKLDKNLVAVELTIPPESIEKALEKAYFKVVRKISLPGFRKGKIPRKILEARFGREILYEDAIDILVPQAYEEALREHKLEPIDQPKFDVVKPFAEGSPFVVKASVEVKPEVVLGDYNGIHVEKPEVVVDDKQVEEYLESLRERYGELVAVDRTVLQQGDFAVVDYEGYIDGQPFPGGAGLGQTVEIGGGSFVPGFAEGLIGMEVGSEREVVVTFPEDYRTRELAGKKAVFKVTLREIKVKELPALDDEFAKALGFETMDLFREDLRKRLQEAAERRRDQDWEEAVVAKAVENATVEVPQILIDREIDRMLSEFEHNLAYQGLSLEQYLKLSEKTLESVRSEFAPAAEKRVKTDLVLEAVGNKEGLQPGEEELKEKIQELVQSWPVKDRLRAEKEFKKPARMDGLRKVLLMEKTVRWLTEHAIPSKDGEIDEPRSDRR